MYFTNFFVFIDSNREIFLDFRKHKKLYIPIVSSEKKYALDYALARIVWGIV